MDRRKFLKTAGLTVAGAFAAPYILPSGRLFAATGTRKVNHVVLCLYAGGVRNLESVQMAEGNLMPNLLMEVLRFLLILFRQWMHFLHLLCHNRCKRMVPCSRSFDINKDQPGITTDIQ